LSNLETFVQRLNQDASSIQFEDTMAIIDELYEFTPTAFQNGEQANEAGQNSGSCKLFAFAQLQNLDEQQTLTCFGQYYREDVLKNPEGNDHQNIRNFITQGWKGISFSGEALKAK
jgi:hypothetical protein